MKNTLKLILLLVITCLIIVECTITGDNKESQRKGNSNIETQDCQGKINNNKKINFMLLESSVDSLAIDKAYLMLKNNLEFCSEGITRNNIKSVTTILKRKDPKLLYNLILESNIFESKYQKQVMQNMYKAFYLQNSDKEKARELFAKNCSLIQLEIDKNRADSTLYYDYFLNKSFYTPKAFLINELDKMTLNNSGISEEFLTILKKEIDEFSSENYMYR